jgi:hypothetical protein
VTLRQLHVVPWVRCFECGAERLAQDDDGPECPACGSGDVLLELVTCDETEWTELRT